MKIEIHQHFPNAEPGSKWALANVLSGCLQELWWRVLAEVRNPQLGCRYIDLIARRYFGKIEVLCEVEWELTHSPDEDEKWDRIVAATESHVLSADKSRLLGMVHHPYFKEDMVAAEWAGSSKYVRLASNAATSPL